MTPQPTLSVSSFNLILFGAHLRGANTNALLQIVGIKNEQLKNPDARIPVATVQRLWHEAIRATDDPHLALHLGEIISPLSAGVLAYVMMHCPTLGKALEKLCHYQDIACEGILTEARLLPQSRLALVLHITTPEIIYPEYALTSEFSVYLAAMRALTGQRVVAEEVHFAFARPSDSQEYERVFAPAPVYFDTQETAFILHTQWLETPILNANPALFAVFDQHASAMLDNLRQTTLVTRVKKEIIALLKGEEPTLSAVADRLAMGVRSLQLHLKEAGTTYQQLLDEVRCDLAIRHLRETYLSTTDIAYLLGFSEPSVFFRSFKRWTGHTPGLYRTLVA